MKLKLHSATGAVILVFLWLASLRAMIELLPGTQWQWLTSAYVPVSFLVMSALWRRKESASEPHRSARATLKGIVLLLLAAAVWLGSLLVVLAEVPPKDLYTNAIWCVWALILLITVWRLEKRWERNGNSEPHF